MLIKSINELQVHLCSSFILFSFTSVLLLVITRTMWYCAFADTSGTKWMTLALVPSRRSVSLSFRLPAWKKAKHFTNTASSAKNLKDHKTLSFAVTSLRSRPLAPWQHAAHTHTKLLKMLHKVSFMPLFIQSFALLMVLFNMHFGSH